MGGNTKIKENIERLKQSRPDLPVEDVIQALVSEYCGPGTYYPPLRTSRLVSSNALPSFTTLALMATPQYNLLVRKWEYYDRESDETYSLTPEQVQEARDHDCFYHPESGEEIPNYSEKILLYYEPSEEFDSWRAGE